MESDKSQQNVEKVGDSAEVWDKRLAEQKRNRKIVQYIRFGLAGAFAIVAIIVLVSYYGWVGKNTYGRLESYKSVSKTMTVSSVFVCIIFVIKMCLEALNGLILSFLYRKKITCEKWDVKAHIKKHSTDMTSAAVRKKYGACVTVAYWEDNPKACKREIITSIIRAILGTVTGICIGIFFVRFMDVVLTNGAYGIKFKLSDCDIRPLIAAGVFAALDIIASFLFNSVNGNGFNEWLEEV